MTTGAIDTLLATTRSVRKRLDFERPVPRGLIEECLALAQQAPTGGNRQLWSFVVVTDPATRAALAEIYRRGWQRYITEGLVEPPQPPAADPVVRARQKRIGQSAQYLADNLERVPALVIPVIRHRIEGRDSVVMASHYGSVLPAVWSFMLAARARGLGTAWTTLHLFYERDAAEVLGIPYDQVTQVALIPVAYTLGDDFKPGARLPLETFVRWNTWDDSGTGRSGPIG
jgi:nitroreductase